MNARDLVLRVAAEAGVLHDGFCDRVVQRGVQRVELVRLDREPSFGGHHGDRVTKHAVRLHDLAERHAEAE